MRESTPVTVVPSHPKAPVAAKVAPPVMTKVRYLPYQSLRRFDSAHPSSRKAMAMDITSTLVKQQEKQDLSRKRALEEESMFQTYKQSRQRLILPSDFAPLDNRSSIVFDRSSTAFG